MSLRGSEIRSGIFVILALVVLSILIFSVGDLQSRFADTVSYHAFLKDAKFLRPHDAVTYSGTRVGKISAVDVSAGRFGQIQVTIEVRRDIPVRRDSLLLLKQDGMLGPKYLEISPGSPDAVAAVPGSELEGRVVPAITDLTTAIEEPLAKLDRILEHLEAILGRPETRESIISLLSDSKKLLATLDEQVRRIGEVTEETGRKAGETLDKAGAAIDEVRETVASNRETLASLLKNADVLSGKLAKTADEMDRLLRDADGMITENHRNVHETIRSMRDASYHMEQLAKRLRADPSVLLFGTKETPEERRRADETEVRLKGRMRRYDKEPPK